MDTTLTATISSLRIERSRSSALLRTAAGLLRSMQTAVVNGPSDGCWRSVDGWSQLALLPTRERERLLDAGRVPHSR